MTEVTLTTNAAGAQANRPNERNRRKWYAVKQFMRSMAILRIHHSASSGNDERHATGTTNKMKPVMSHSFCVCVFFSR